MKKRAILQSNDGLTLVEVVFSAVILAVVLGAGIGTFVFGRYSAAQARHHIQAMNLLREKAEELASQPFVAVDNEAAVAITIDTGLDAGDAGDDLAGTIQVVVQDTQDLDGDADMVEQMIDVNGDGQNDFCKPVTITVAWQERTFGGTRNVTEVLTTLISQ